MKIAIIGGGAIGLLFAYYLNQKHHVVLYVRNRQQMDILRRKGLFLHKKDHTYKTELEVRNISDWGRFDEDVSIICVKQYHLKNLLDESGLTETHPLIFVQNGMGHLKIIDKLPTQNVSVATVEHGALKSGDCEVIHTGEGLTRIAVYRGENQELLQRLIAPLGDDFPFITEKDYYKMLVKKLVVNAVINPLTAVLKVPNGQLLDNPRYFELLTGLFHEVKAVLHLENEKEYFNNLLQVCRNTAKNRSSMLKDIEEQRPTEIDAILGFLLEEAAERNIPAPYTTMLYQMIKGIELQNMEG